MRTTLCPENLPKATIKLVFPTPGLPSNKTGKKNKGQLRMLKQRKQRIPEHQQVEFGQTGNINQQLKEPYQVLEAA